MAMEHPVRVMAILVWAGLWALVLVLDPGFGVVDQPALLIALTVLPQILLGYVVGMRATLCVLPLGVAWALILHSDCVASTSIGGECSVTTAGIFGLAVIWVLILGYLIAAGAGLRIGVARWSHDRA
jgi:hypothetical protein